jgi:pimeloyl-ACP methyl ester carboxylesterase
MVPETRYARSGNLHIAYQVTGDGPVALVFVHGWISHIEHLWEEPSLARLLNRLASFSRLILLDKRGTGLSDPVPLDKLPTLEEPTSRLLPVPANTRLNLARRAAHPVERIAHQHTVTKPIAQQP